jgi:hypothetical protein
MIRQETVNDSNYAANIGSFLSDQMTQQEDRRKIPSHTSSRNKNDKKSVAFNPNALLRLVPSLLDAFSEDAIAKIWYNSVEYKLIRKEALESASLMRQGVPENDAILRCYRGLEWKAEGEPLLLRKKLVRARAKEAVFDEQEEQWAIEESNPGRMAAVYMIYTDVCREDAIRRARRDAEEAEAYCLSDRQVLLGRKSKKIAQGKSVRSSLPSTMRRQSKTILSMTPQPTGRA